MMKRNLPNNWIVLNSKTHPDREYYFNTKTNQSTWNKPTDDQTKQARRRSVRHSKKHKVSLDKDEVSQVKPTSPKQDIPETEIKERKKLVAKRSLQQSQEKINMEMETPQMKQIREKMLKKKEINNAKIQSSKLPKTPIKSAPSNLDSPLPQKSNTNMSPKSAYTPQMQVLLEKLQEKASRRSPKLKKTDQDIDKDIHKGRKKIKTRLRNPGVGSLKSTSNFSSSVLNKSNERQQDSPKAGSIEIKVAGKRRDRERDVIEDVPAKKVCTPLRTNLAKLRMEKLRKSLTAQNTDDESPCKSSGKLPVINKKAEVRLTRLKGRFSNGKISINTNPHIDEFKETANSSQGSITPIVDLVKQSSEDSFYEEMDWEPMEDDKITFEVQTVRTQLGTENSTNTSCKLLTNPLTHPVLSDHQEKGQLYIVVDTNVFLSNIKAIDLARETAFKTYDRPFIVIPWTVIRELDYIKDNHDKTRSASLRATARTAVRYINKLFSSNHSRVIGQTPEDVAKNKEKFAADCPDDEILQTCLHIRDLGKSVVLLSYDVNLCNKAMIYDIVTLGRNDPLEKVDYLNAINYTNKSLSSSDNGNRESFPLDVSTVLNQEQYFADEIFEDLKCILRDFLTVIVSKEMNVLYGEFWEKYVIIKPPWTTVTVLQCAVKHWIAAISESFPKKAELILKELLQIFKNPPGIATLKEDNYILEKCNDLVQMVHVNKYPDLMSRVSRKINELKGKCRNYERQINERKLRDSIGAEQNIEEEERRAQRALHYFEATYVFARDMCGLAAEAVRMPCSFHYNIPNPPPSVDYVQQIQPELAANVNKLLCSLRAAIEYVKNPSADYRALINLHQTLITSLPESAPPSFKLIDDLEPLDVYCCVKRKQEMLNRGLRQLQDLSTHFCRLASY